MLLYSLKDSDDDVRAVASDTLLPIATEAASLVRDQMPEILSILWDILLELDQLTASTNSVMNLLGVYAGITCIQHFLILTLLLVLCACVCAYVAAFYAIPSIATVTLQVNSITPQASYVTRLVLCYFFRLDITSHLSFTITSCE